MIVFNGTDLEELVPIKIDDIMVSPIALNAVTRQRAIAPGQDFVRMQEVSRNVAVTFALLNMNRDERYQALQEITKWANVGNIGQLSLPMMPGFHLDAACTGLPEPSYRMWWESKLRLSFSTFDNPFWTMDDETVAQCNQDITIGGNAPPLMRIERNLASADSNKGYNNGSEDMLFTQIPAGRLVIDLNRQTSVVSGTSIARYLTPTSQYIIPKTGSQRIRGTGTIYYRERWI